MGRMGENLAREWREDAHAPALWDALQLIKSDKKTGMDNLLQLAEEGSPLAMMYLGSKYIAGRDGVPRDEKLGEKWLRRSALAGSLEAGYGLARYLQSSHRYDEAIYEYKKLASQEYMPALYILGWQYYMGEIVEKDIQVARSYFSRAEKRGHVVSSYWSARILMNENLGGLSWLRGLLKRVFRVPPLLWLALRYPKSDRLRR